MHFEIHATDPEALRKFHEFVVDWRITPWGYQPYVLINTGDGWDADGRDPDGNLSPLFQDDPAVA